MEDAYVLQLSDRKFSELYLCSCGYSKCEPLHSFGPAVRPYYLIHCVLRGKGRYCIGDTQYSLEAGQGFLIEPNVLTFYQADADKPWEYLWVGFSGTNVKEYLLDLGLNNEQLAFRNEYMTELKQAIVGMMKHATGSITSQYERQSFLYSFFAILSRNSNLPVLQEQEGENIHVKHAVEFVRNNYFSGIKVADIAKYACVDRTYLYELFRKYLKVSPQEYLTNYRMSRAAELLTLTDLTMGEIALSCGYQSAFSFGKVFKAKRGITPARYREKNRSEKREYLESHKEKLEEI